MALQVHPHIGYLNTKFSISNTREYSVIVTDKQSGWSERLGPKSSIAKSFAAGSHSLVVDGPDNIKEEVGFVVEDAFKFGGSKRKSAYIFDDTSWAIIVMKDRTYFFNEETGEQFVEHNLSPDSIEQLNGRYLLFETKGEISFYSLESFTVKQTISEVKKVSSDCSFCVLDGGDKLIIINIGLEEGLKEWRINKDSFVIQRIPEKKESVVRYHESGYPNLIKTVRLFEESAQVSFEDAIEVEGEFICFPGQHSVLSYKRSEDCSIPTVLMCTNLYTTSTVEICSGDIPLREVNDIELWKTNDFLEYKNAHSGDGLSFKVKVADVLEDSGTIYTIITTTSFAYEKQKKSDGIEILVEKQTVKSYLFAYGFRSLDGEIIYSSQHSLTFIKNGNLSYVKDDNNLFIIKGKDVKQMKGSTVVKTLQNDYYIICFGNEKSLFYTINGSPIFTIRKEYSFDIGNQYGLFCQGYNKYYWLKTGKTYYGSEVKLFKEGSDLLIMYGGGQNMGPRFLTREGKSILAPVPPEYIISVSSSAKAVFYEKGGQFFVTRFNGQDWSDSGALPVTIYDNLKVEDAVFCSDGESFIYQKDGELVMFDFTTGKESSFMTNTGIQNNFNGYRPYCNRDFFARPVIVDPITNRTINHDFLSQYRFASLDGRVYYEEMVVKYFMKKDKKEISKTEYDAFKNKFDISIVDSKTERAQKEKRMRHYWREELNHKDPLYIIPYSMEHRSFVDDYIVDREHFAIIDYRGEKVEIALGWVYFLNYVSFSSDATLCAISLKYKDSSGRCLVYDLQSKEVYYDSMKYTGKIMAVWLGLFSKNDDLAFYDSTPNTFYLAYGDLKMKPMLLSNRSFLAFSPSGKYMALSKQGYAPISKFEETGYWGHMPSSDVYIVDMDDPKEAICHFNDHGSGIAGVATEHDTVASASFSSDEKRLLSVSNDGVVVVRNLHLERI